MPLSISLPTMPVEKLRISSPLEAGPSLLDAKMLPPQLTSALEYVSSRLVRKRLHLSLIVVRKDVQVPQSRLPPSPTRSISVTSSPAKSLFGTASSTITNTLRRVSSRSSLSDCSGKSSPSSPSFSDSPSSPSSPSWSEPSTPNPYGISLIHACTLTPKAEKILRHYIHRAEKKFAIGSGWLSTESLATPITCSATNDLIRRSLAQNSIVFSSEGLTLLALDHLYTFKCHLHTYSRTLSPSDFSLAVDELHRLVLAQQGRRITKGYLMRAYDWLGVSLAALVDVNEGYKTAYGGEQRWGGIEVLNEERKSPPPLKTDFSRMETRKMRMASSPITPGGNAGGVSPGWNLRAVSVGNEDIKPSAAREVQVGESAQGVDRDVLLKGHGENLFEEAARLPEDRGPHRRGATTPNGFEDITPVTKGEWLCLMVGDGWKEAKTAPIVTC